MANLALVAIWLVLAVLIGREYRAWPAVAGGGVSDSANGTLRSRALCPPRSRFIQLVEPSQDGLAGSEQVARAVGAMSPASRPVVLQIGPELPAHFRRKRRFEVLERRSPEERIARLKTADRDAERLARKREREEREDVLQAPARPRAERIVRERRPQVVVPLIQNPLIVPDAPLRPHFPNPASVTISDGTLRRGWLCSRWLRARPRISAPQRRSEARSHRRRGGIVSQNKRNAPPDAKSLFGSVSAATSGSRGGPLSRSAAIAGGHLVHASAMPGDEVGAGRRKKRGEPLLWPGERRGARGGRFR
jgi:hypothetical protein